MSANIINHIVLVLDASASMRHLSEELVKVADNQIKYLATRSQELGQETRITVYTFATHRVGFKVPDIECLIYDMDVLRVPSISSLYRTAGMTPLIDAAMLALGDLAMTPEKYGEHSFLVYVLTDGQENASGYRPTDLLSRINGLPEHWTVACFVPDKSGADYAKRYGFPANNIALWDATTVAGVSEAGAKIRQTTDNFMAGRAQGIRGTKNLFSMEQPSLAKVSQSLIPLQRGTFRLFDVYEDGRIDQTVAANTRRTYKRGEAYYQLTKREEIQPQKKVAIVRRDGNVYVGDTARQLLGLPDQHVRVSPDHNPDYDIFVQSTSDNRKLIAGTKLLVLA